MKKILLSILTLVCTLGIAKAQDDVQVLIDTDFSVFTEGSEESPQSLYSSTFNSKVDGYYMISGVSAAGGKILIGSSGYIQLKEFSSLPSAGGTIRITAEVKMLDSYGGALQFTRGYSSDIEYVAVESDDWTTVTVMAGGYTNTSSSRLKVQPFLSINGLYLKSLKVEYSADFIAAPEAYLPADADGTQFTALCSRVTGASSYEADVFSLDADGNPVYFVQNAELKALSVYSNPSAKVTDLDPATTYYYVARALNADGKKSENSNVVEVIKKISSIAAPEALPASAISEDGFTANWTAVDGASYYIVYTYEKTTLTEAAEAPVFSEDFSGVNVGTISSVEFSGSIDDFTKLPGWATDASKAYAAGYYVFSIYTGNTGTLTTPEIDLSANDGKFSLDVNAFTGRFGNMYATANTLGAELLEDGEVIETAETLVCDKTGPADFVFNFTKGSANSRIRLTYTLVDDDSNKLYIDAITINQLMPAGTVIQEIIANQSAEGTSAQVKLTPEQGKDYGYYVVSVGLTVVGSSTNTAVGEILSAASNSVDVDFTTLGIADVTAADEAPKAWKESDGVLGVNGSNIAVFDLMGRSIYREVHSDGVHTLNLGLKGIVIVCVDGESYKIAL